MAACAEGSGAQVPAAESSADAAARILAGTTATMGGGRAEAPGADGRPTVLVVDDVPENIDILVALLKQEYAIRVATTGERALRLAVIEPQPDLILLDVMMPGLSGYDVCRALKGDVRTRAIPVIFITAMSEIQDEAAGFEAGCVDYVVKPISPPIVLARVRTQLALHNQQRHLEMLVGRRTVELEQTRLKIIQTLGRAAEFKDEDTGEHVVRMALFSRLIGRAGGMSDRAADLLFAAAPMHDLGKIGIPDHILRKPGKLTPEEWAVVKTHPEIGARIIGSAHGNSPLLNMAREIALSHHEKWDGEGYPNRLKGDQIPLVGRIATIADVFDALTSVRPYKRRWPVADAIRFISDHAGSHFDPTLVRCFHQALPEILEITARHTDPGATDDDQRGAGS